ncbi:hypothetical protein P43SY_003712 [Pythium insidiosum]|uniref:EF-hand domain-containing protein n=1 Tax=Pythium insidiosum TaxID=114742 RepID=A0AAD5L9D3_PYTIN|nr:hypothetical protein P43SY_003712 [Pythium insidiosum]
MRLATSPQRPKSILKKERELAGSSLPSASTRARESPTAWFRRVLRAKQLSVVDLCDLFCFGDASKHRVVPLRHACEVLFDLEPSPETNDPLTPAMEELLYRFSFPSERDESEIVVDIKEALRSLDLWQHGASASSRGPLTARDELEASPAKTTMLQVKTDRLQRVVSHLQLENERLKDEVGADERVESRAPSPLAVSIKPAPTASGTASSSPPRGVRRESSSVVTPHERDLVQLAERLQYGGVKRLEELLERVDAQRSGFMSLKELRWLLAHDLGVDMAETRLMELCLGLNFNAQGQLDHKELTRLLQDVLLYEPQPRDRSGAASVPSVDRAVMPALRKIREYLRGLHTTRERTHALLSTLCDKYDLEGNAEISVVELARVLRHDLPAHHSGRLAFPLARDETLATLQRLVPSGSQFLHYPTVLRAIVDGQQPESERDADSADADSERENEDDEEQHKATTRGFDAAFWRALRRALCGDDRRGASDVHQQLCKILLKLDPQRSFEISARHFRRVFDQHWSERDMELALRLLAPPASSSSSSTSTSAGGVRYDVLMKLVFGAPELRDRRLLGLVSSKLDAAGWRPLLSALLTKHGSAFRLSLAQFYELSRSARDTERDGRARSPRRRRCRSAGKRLSPVELLFVFAWLDDRHGFSVELSRLWDLVGAAASSASSSIASSCSTSSRLPADAPAPLAREFESLRRRLRVLCDPPCELETTLQRQLATRFDDGVVRLSELSAFLVAQLATLRGAPPATRTAVDRFLRAVAATSRSSVAGDGDGDRDSGWLSIASLMDALMDWKALAATLRLPERLVDVKRTLELFDWHQSGDLDMQDWPKAWRQLAAPSAKKTPAAPLRDWELRVLLRRFASVSSPSSRTQPQRRAETPARLDYARLLVFLMDVAQRDSRERAQHVVLSLLRRRLQQQLVGERRRRHLTTQDTERAFAVLDCDGKGYFTRSDLLAFVRRELEGDAWAPHRQHGSERALTDDEEEDNDDDDASEDRELLRRELAMQGEAWAHLDAVFAELMGVDPGRSPRQRGSLSPDVVTLLRFQQLVPRLLGTSGDRDGDAELSRGHRNADPPSHQRAHVTTLRALEDAVRDIARRCVDATGHVSPAQAFKLLSAIDDDRDSRRPRSQSPSRRSEPPQRRLQQRRASCDSPMRSESPVVAASELDPLTPKRLKHTLRLRHALEVSTYLLGQFFLHLGASTPHFLELAVFARWLAPLSTELQTHGVRRVVHAMLVKAKAGGGQLDLERFLSLLERRIEWLDRRRGDDFESRNTGARATTAVAPPALVLTALHQLNVPLRQSEWQQLLRHFGMEDQRLIDARRVVRLLYELDAESKKL